MQETLTYYKYKNFKSNMKNSNFTKIFKVFLITFSIIFMLIILKQSFSYKTNYNKKRTYYLLSLNQTNNIGLVNQTKDAANEYVGESYVFKNNEVYHIIGFVYDNLSDAENFLNVVKKSFVQAKVIKLTQPKIKNKINTKIKENFYLKNAYKFHINLPDKLLNSLKKIEQNDNLSYIYKKLTEIELALSQNLNNLKEINQDELCKEIFASISLVNDYIKSCKQNIIVGDNLINKTKELYLKCFFEINNLKVNLNKL